MKVEIFLKEIKTLTQLEKSIIPLVNRHISSSLFFSDMKPAERSVVLTTFQNMAVIQSKHVEILEVIAQAVAKKDKDVL
jgi:hypothetical protein